MTGEETVTARDSERTDGRSTKAIDVAGLDGGFVSLTAERLDALDSRVERPLLRPGDAGWDDAVLIWNGMVAKAPALVLQPTSAAHVAAAVGSARDHGLLLSIKGGGHNMAGTSIAERGLTLDMSRMRDVIVDPEARLAHVGSGCRLRDVDRATQAHGLATPLGSFDSGVGVAGLTLGGGLGYLTRRFGWTVDNLEEVEIVTADGQIRTASRDENADLLWALRGGGGNFGVVTRFTYRLHDVGPTITAASSSGAPTGSTTCSQPRCHSGADAKGDLAPVRALGDPIADLVTEKPYTDQQSMMDGMEPKGHHHYWKTEYLAGLTNEFLDTFRDSALRVTCPLSDSIVIHLAGALNERADDDGAVGNRDARYMTAFAGQWPPGAPADEHVAWVREAWKSVQPHSTGGNYLNFQTADEDEQRVRATYGPTSTASSKPNRPTTLGTCFAATATSGPEPEPGPQGRGSRCAIVVASSSHRLRSCSRTKQRWIGAGRVQGLSLGALPGSGRLRWTSFDTGRAPGRRAHPPRTRRLVRCARATSSGTR